MQKSDRPSARIGYATSAAGDGIAYARLVEGNRARTLCARFRIRGGTGDDEREAAFAAVCAIAPLLRKHVAEINLHVDDPRLAADLTQHCDLPVPLFLSYVRARCALNAFGSAHLTVAAGPNDLAARARAEVSLLVAA
jgi:hypothetical protein